VGANGAGKSTLMRAIMGLAPILEGAIEFDGRSIRRLPTHAIARSGIALVPEGRGPLRQLTVGENLRLGAFTRRWNAETRRDFDEALERFPPLKPRLAQLAGTLSGGEQQMLALGRALVGGPKVLLLDEPSEGIQPSIVQEIEVKIASISRARGLAIVLVEQNIELAAALARRIYVMEKGRIAREIAPENVMDEDIVRDYLAV